MKKEKKMTHIQIRIEETLKDEIQESATADGRSLSSWLRQRAIEYLRREKGKTPEPNRGPHAENE